MVLPIVPIIAGSAIAGAAGSLAGGGKTSSDYGGGPSLITNTTANAPKIPYSSSPGLQPGNADNGINGVSYRDPTRLENAVDAGVNWAPTNAQQVYSGQFAPGMSTPGTGQTYVNNALQQPTPQVSTGNTQQAYDWFKPNQPNVSTGNTQQAYDWFKQNQPNLAQDPGLAPYYDNAKRRAIESVNQNAAARGMFGSTVAMDQGNEAITNLEAERANREADYSLQREAERRAWGTAGVGAAGTADSAKLGAAGENRAWTTGMGGLGLSADESERARLAGLFGGAGTLDSAINTGTAANLSALGAADTAGFGRAQGAYDMSMGLGNATSNAAGDAYQQMLAQDAALRDQYMAMALGMPTEAFNASQTSQQNTRQDINQAMDIMTWAKSMGLGGGAAGA